MSRPATRFFAACVAVALVLALPAGAARSQPADETLSIIAGNAAPGIFDTLELIAAGAGFYGQQHLTVSKNYATNPGVATQLVATGKADVASLSVEPILIGSEKGIHLTVFLSRQSRFSYVLAVLANSPIKTLEDFKGATLGEVNAGSAGEPATESMLAGAGVARSAYSFVPIGVGSQGLAAITGKRVDGVAIPYLEIVNDEVGAGVPFRVWRHPILKDVGNVGYAATPATIQAKAEALRRFSRAIVEAAILVRVNPALGARLYLTGSGQKVTADSLQSTTRVLQALEDDFPAANLANPRIGLIRPRDMQLYSQYLAQYGFMKAPVDGKSVATDQFIAYANGFDRKALEKQIASMH